jgi:hypothetical protein
MPREPKRQDDSVPDEQTAIEAVTDSSAAAPQGNSPNVGDTVICTGRLRALVPGGQGSSVDANKLRDNVNRRISTTDSSIS